MDGALRLAGMFCLIALLLAFAVRLIESVAIPLLIGIGIISTVGVLVWLVRRRQSGSW